MHNQASELQSSSTTSAVAEPEVQKHSRSRSYFCSASGCTLSQGFTSKGDLTRHQREVHESGGSRAFLCPHSECKRSSGQPFKRRENLNGHLKRVHRSVAAAIDSDNDTTELSAPLRSSKSPHFHPPLSVDCKERSEVPQVSTKRQKRQLEPGHLISNVGIAAHTDDVDDDSEAEVKRLRQLLEWQVIELKTITAERDRLRKAEIGKDAQIRLLRDMVQNHCSGRLSTS